MPGDNVSMTVKLIAPIAMEEGLRFAIRRRSYRRRRRRCQGHRIRRFVFCAASLRGDAEVCRRGIAQLAERRSPKPKVGVRFPLPCHANSPDAFLQGRQTQVCAGAAVGGGRRDRLLPAPSRRWCCACSPCSRVCAGAAWSPWFSAPGQQFAGFVRETIVETKKVVWPSRKGNAADDRHRVRLHGVHGLFLWLTDKSLEWVLYDLVLGWKEI